MKTSYAIGIIAVIVIVGGFLYYSHASSSSDTTQRPLQTGTEAPQMNQPSAPSAPHIASLSPATGPAGTTVTITGTGFDMDSNEITFGDSNGRHHKGGTPDNVIDTASLTDMQTLTFTVPASGPSGILCDASEQCIAISAMLRQPGDYKVSVVTPQGTSNVVTFTMTK